MACARRPVHINKAARSWSADRSWSAEDKSRLDRFHSQFAGGPTKLVRLADELAAEIGVKAIFIKDESTRFGLSSFKILGASWATFRALASELGLPSDAGLDALKTALESRPLTLYAATAGNHGRAVAHMASLLGIASEIHVPFGMHAPTIRGLQDEGAKVLVNAGTYDDAMHAAEAAAKLGDGLLVQDCSFDGYTKIPKWIIEGYRSMMHEIDAQLDGETANLVVTPVGVGSLAEAVVSHYKREDARTAIMTVESDTAACLYKSLRAGRSTPIQTYATIMAGLDCATLSESAWPLLQSGVDASLTVSDFEAHRAVQYLQAQGISAGPCGAAPIAALRRLSADDKTSLDLDENSVVVLLCTEGGRDYRLPMDVSWDDPVAIAQALVRIDSSNPSLGSVPGPGETEIACYIGSWLEHRNIEAHWVEPTKGRPSIVGVVRGSGGGKSIMFNGHIDTVTTIGYDHDPLGGEIRDGKLYGRGAQDMKGGLAAAMSALAAAQKENVRGDVILTGVADEEATSIGTEQVLAAGWRADAAIVTEPTNEDIVHAHKGFIWLKVQIHGLAAHGSMALVGVDAITKAGYFLVELDRYSQNLSRGYDDPVLAPSVHASIIKGGEEESSYPALCTILVERRTIAGETATSITAQFQGMLDHLAKTVKDFRGDVRVTFERPAFSIDQDHPFSRAAGKAVSQVLGREAKFEKGPFWTDCALLAEKGIPVLLWGPKGDGLHGKEEWVDVASIQRVAAGLNKIVRDFCS